MSVTTKAGCCNKLMFTTALAITAICFSVSAAGTEKERAGRSFKIGYDQGISCRYYPNDVWGFGVVLFSPNWNGIYLKENSERSQVNENDSWKSSDSNSEKGIAASFEVVRLIKRSNRFTLNVFASVGGEFTNRIRSTRYDSRYYDIGGDSIVGRSDFNAYNTNNTAVSGRFGIMPGVVSGPISIEFRLGVEGRYSVEKSPERATYRIDGKTSSIKFIYPGSLVQSLIIHYEF